MTDTHVPSTSVERVRRHRARKADDGYRQVTTTIPDEIIEFLDKQRRVRGLSSRGHVLAALVRETETFQQFKEEKATS